MYVCTKCSTVISDRTASQKNNEWRGHKCPKCFAELEYVNELQSRALKYKQSMQPKKTNSK